MATHQISLLGPNTSPDSSGNIWQDLFSRLATNDVWPYGVFNFGGTIANNTAPTTRIGLYGNCQIPNNLNVAGTVTIIPVWTASVITNDVVWDFDYRVVGGNDTTSLDQSGVEESDTVTDTAPGAAWRRLTPSITPTTANFTPGATLQWGLFRDGTDAADTMAGTAVLVDLILQYTD